MIEIWRYIFIFINHDTIYWNLCLIERAFESSKLCLLLLDNDHEVRCLKVRFRFLPIIFGKASLAKSVPGCPPEWKDKIIVQSLTILLYGFLEETFSTFGRSTSSCPRILLSQPQFGSEADKYLNSSLVRTAKILLICRRVLMSLTCLDSRSNFSMSFDWLTHIVLAESLLCSLLALSWNNDSFIKNK